MKRIACGALLLCSLHVDAQSLPLLGKSSVDDIVRAMTMEEKISLLMGAFSDDSVLGADMLKPLQELKAFAKTHVLAPRESETVELMVKADDLSSFSEEDSAWVRENGTYKFRIGASSRDIRLTRDTDVTGKVWTGIYPVAELIVCH